MEDLTTTEQRIYSLLSDGQPHTREELHACLDDPLSSLGALRTSICRLREKLPEDEDIVCVMLWPRKFAYRYVRVIIQD